ncbi:MAG: hypothetical protein KAG61_06240 [Bacteriovoracaceae bacterium]|nr:hypothetical protein [Bacteriovoracaceae bacterium]
MKKRLIIAITLLISLIVVLGMIQGLETLPSYASLLPPFIAIAAAFVTYEVVSSLFLGILLGAVISFNPSSILDAIMVTPQSFFKVADTYIIGALADSDHVSVIIFTMFIGGVVGVIARSGGLQGIVLRLSSLAKNSKLAQLYTWLMGCLIFFDDYANTLIVGNTMRPITDKFRVSREKLSFLVDSTAAPVTSLVIVSTWIGYEVGLILDVFNANGMSGDPYMAFINSIPYRFYVILMLLFIPLSIMMGRDFSSMYDAEKRARDTGETLKKGSTPISEAGSLEFDFCETKGVTPRAMNAIIPIVVLIIGVLVGLYVTGHNSIVASAKGSEVLDLTVKNILGNSNSFKALVWASLFASLVSITLVTVQKILTIEESIKCWINGMKSMFMAAVILTMAWSLGAVLKDINTAQTVTNLLGGVLSIEMLPLLVFLVSAVTAFSTGTSWGAMAILFPLAIPLANKIGANLPPAELSMAISATIGSILSGTVFGDHCSPISDTTIMSSIASEVDHMDHVTTQLPYALSIGAISCVVGYLPSGFGFNPFASIAVGLILVVALLLIFGKKVPNISN